MAKSKKICIGNKKKNDKKQKRKLVKIKPQAPMILNERHSGSHISALPAHDFNKK